MRWLYWTIATALGSGFSPLAPGTAGSLLAVLVAYWLFPSTLWVLPLATLGAFLVGIPAASRVARDTQQEDPQIVVIDEVVGMWIALWTLPKSLVWYGVAFLAFRLFDVWKPFPVRQAERPGLGLGIMLDDVVAGGYALVTVQLLQLFS